VPIEEEEEHKENTQKIQQNACFLQILCCREFRKKHLLQMSF
jgi:hypothetical protein